MYDGRTSKDFLLSIAVTKIKLVGSGFGKVGGKFKTGAEGGLVLLIWHRK